MSLELDETSLMVHASADTTLRAVEDLLATRGLTLDLEGADWQKSVGQWLAEGAQGARTPWLDPVDQLVSGFEGKLEDGRALVVRPCPRRAVGPDLFALVYGARERFVRLTGVWLRAHARAATRPSTEHFRIAEDRPLEEGERAMLDRIALALPKV